MGQGGMKIYQQGCKGCSIFLSSPLRAEREKSKDSLHPLHPPISQSLTPPHNLRYCTTMAPRPPEERAHALDLLRAGTPAPQVAKTTGIPRRTIAQWAADESIDTVAQAVTKTARARQALAATAEERRATLAAKLLEVAECAAAVELDRIADGSASLHEIVGARTRAIHDMQLLSGEATARTEHQAPDRTPDAEAEVAQVLALVRTKAA